MVTRVSQFQAESGFKAGNFDVDESGNLPNVFLQGVSISEFSVDPTMEDNSAQAVPTESAVRGYIDRRLGFTHQGTSIAEGSEIGAAPFATQAYADAIQTSSENYAESYTDSRFGNIAITGNAITSEDSSSISFTPSVIFNSDLTVENDLVVGNLRVTQNGLSISGLADVDTQSSPPTPGQVLKWDGSKWAPGNDITTGGAGLDADTLDGFDSNYFLNYNNLSSLPDLTNPSFNSVTITGLSTLQQLSEVLNTKTSATGSVTHDFSTGSIWYHSSISTNFTAAFTNVPTTNNRTISITLILSQGATGRYPNAVAINGSTVSINWVGNLTPSPSTNRFDIVSFLLVRVSNNWVVLGSLTPY